MKSILLGLSGLIFLLPLNYNSSLNFSKLNNFPDYTTEWTEIESLIQKGLIEDALINTQKLNERAFLEKNNPQIYKSILYIENLSSQKDELHLKGIIQRLENKLLIADTISKSMLQSVLGSLYFSVSQNYHNGRRSELKDGEQDSTDILTWSSQKLIRKANAYIELSIQNKALKTQSTADYKAILIEQTNLNLCPTLYEVMLHRAVEYFSNSNTTLVDFDVSLSKEIQFSSLDNFLSEDLKSHPVFTIFQTWLKYLVSAKQINSLILANLQRLEYAKNLNTDKESLQLYKANLDEFYNKFESSEFSYIILSKIILYLQESNNKEDSSSKNNFIHIDSISKLGVSKYKDSAALNYFNQVMQELRQPLLIIQQEKNIPANLNSKFLLEFKNINKLYFKVYKIPVSGLQTINYPNIQISSKELIKYKLIKAWADSWTNPVDFNMHSIEIKIDPLDFGRYYLVASEKEKLEESVILKGGFFQVSNLASFQFVDKENNSKVVVVDRTKGSPIKNVNVYFYKQKSYRYDLKPELELVSTKKTDQNGIVTVQNKDYLQYYIESGKDIYTNQEGVYKAYDQNNYEYTNLHFFTDRSVYRPGQTVYFKFIAVQSSSSNSYPNIIKNKSFVIRLRNSNYQEVSKISLKSNQFGSANGSFILPNSGLNGNFSIESDYGASSIQVEEYKQPSFEIVFDTIRESYKLNQHVTIRGIVKTYNGIPLSEAKIVYKVNRNSFFPYYYWRMNKGIESPNEQIAFGTATTNDKGEFEFEFLATENKESNFNNAINQFNIIVDATNQNQETQSNTQNLSLSHKSFFIKPINKEFLQAEKDSITIQAANINGEALISSLKIKVFSLNHNRKFLKERFWKTPDINRYSIKEFNKLFPDDVFLNEDKKENWEINKLEYETQLASAKTHLINIADLNLKNGSYKLQIEASDNQGNKEQIEEFVTVVDPKTKTNTFIPTTFILDKKYEPQQSIYINQLAIGQDYHLFYSIQSKNMSKSSWLKVDNNKTLKYIVNEEDRGGISYSGICIYKNRSFIQSKSIDVPWSNKKLTIVSESFRNKLLPGQDEEWSFKVSNSMDSKEKFELLASMYDQSLDQLLPHQWNFNILPSFYSNFNFSTQACGSIYLNDLKENIYNSQIDHSFFYTLPNLNTFGLLDNIYSGGAMPRYEYDASSAPSRSMREEPAKAQNVKSKSQDKNQVESNDKTPKVSEKAIQIRKNLNETVFFYPNISSNDSGQYVIKFKMNEAMSRWKLQLFAHSMDLKYGQQTLEVISQKPLEIRPFYPRFLRQGDLIQLSASIYNLSEKPQSGKASMRIFDAQSLKDITSEIINSNIDQNFQVELGKSEIIHWQLKIPSTETRNYVLRYTAQGEIHSDGEEKSIPVVSNRKLVTETLPLPVNAGQTKSFVFNSVKQLGNNGSIPQQFTLEFSSHPVWYAIQMLPYLMDYPNECNEQIMSKIFAHSIGTQVMIKFPKVSSVLKKMISEGTIESKLLQNQELKSALIEETPWVLAAQSESDQMKQVALLLDLNNMADNLSSSISKLKNRQNSDGSFSWFPGSYPDRFITQHIVVQIAHLNRLKLESESMNRLNEIAFKARKFLDYTILKDYEILAENVKSGKAKWEDNHLGSIELHYYYCKSLFKDWTSDKEMTQIDNYYINQIDKFWISRNIYDQGLCAIVASKKNNNTLVQLIVKSLKQRSLMNEELGRYWKSNWSYNWNQLPVETQALMIEVFYDLAKDNNTVNELKTWLLKNKQTQHWGTTKATSEAIYSVLAFGENYLEESEPVSIEIAKDKLDLSQSTTGTSYFKKVWMKSEIKVEFANIRIKNPNKSIVWGSAYYQYFQDLDKIEQSEMKELILNKELYIKHVGKKGAELNKITDSAKIKTGDVVTARIIIKADRPMEYIHLKVMRAAGLEPIKQLSGYHYEGGLSFYASPKDLSTDFFISYLPKGVYVLEYDLRASFKGKFYDGISSLQCMYAPEFSSHSKGIQLQIE
ncbi:MAG: alpha-2-macroglobulin family protein [Saprospiraceae bacterium]